MSTHRFTVIMALVAVTAALLWGIPQAFGNNGPAGVTFCANSPAGGASGKALRKFVDGVPGLGPTHANKRGQYIPIAIPDTPGIRLLPHRHSPVSRAVSQRPAQGFQGAGGCGSGICWDPSTGPLCRSHHHCQTGTAGVGHAHQHVAYEPQ